MKLEFGKRKAFRDLSTDGKCLYYFITDINNVYCEFRLDPYCDIQPSIVLIESSQFKRENEIPLKFIKLHYSIDFI